MANFSGALCVAFGERSRGSVFQTDLPFRQESRGFKNPRLLRDRPSDGAAGTYKFYAVIFGESMAGRFLRIFEGHGVWLLAKGHAGQSERLTLATHCMRTYNLGTNADTRIIKRRQPKWRGEAFLFAFCSLGREKRPLLFGRMGHF